MALGAGAAVMVTCTWAADRGASSSPRTAWRRWPSMAKLLGREVRLVQDWVDGGFEVKPGEVVLLENCRLNKGEKKNNPELAAKIGQLCDIFVHDAFGTAHRAEATTYGIAETAPVACAGPLLAAEMDAISRRWRTPGARWWRSWRQQGIDQAEHPQDAGDQGRPADRRRRHRQHLPAAAGKPVDSLAEPRWCATAQR